jgi:hypothetical protein
MDSEWLSDCITDSIYNNSNSEDFLYCPYTNSSNCALFLKGKHSTALCKSLECSKLSLYRKMRKNGRVA